MTQQTAKIPTSIQAAVSSSNAAVKKMAEQFASTKQAKSFNLIKSAQSRVGQGNVVFGPTEQWFPSVNQIGNDWHVTERNKGWGLKVNEFFGIDYEMVWRKHVMDKYHQSYRDKDGNWVGGYIEKRFEVDKNISDLNNIQLKPGQLRKPYVPEYSLTEARLESKREKDGVEGAKVFNWKKASAQPVVKTAEKSAVHQSLFEKPINFNPVSNPARFNSLSKKKVVAFNGLQPMEGMQSMKPLQAPGAKSTGPAKGVWNCPGCGALRAATESQCQNCGMSKAGQPTSFAIQPQGIKPGQKPSWNKSPTTPTHIKKNQPLSRAASVLSDSKEDDKEKDDALEDDTEFKQVLSEPQDQLSQVLEHHKKRERSFDALCGGPDTGQTMIQPMPR